MMITFPDGTELLLGPVVVVERESVSDHGHASYVDDVRSYWKTEVRGVAVLVPLVGLEARRIA
jgi:hypothetical protein